MTRTKAGRTTLWFGGALLVLGAGMVMRARLKRWAYNGIARHRWQQPERVMEALRIGREHEVLDLGAGGGYFTFRLAKEARKVYASDVDRKLLELLQKDAEREGHDNVDVVLAEQEDPHVPGPVDLVLVSNTYHHLPEPSRYFAGLRPRLAAHGRVAIIEPEPSAWAGRLGHGTDRSMIRDDMERAGYRVVDEHDFLTHQSFIVFEPD